MNKVLIFVVFISLPFYLMAQQKDSISMVNEKEYPIIVQDSPSELYTMRQFNESSLSLYRLAIDGIDKAIPSKRWNVIATELVSLFYIPMTHEEGHRAVLTYKNIGSISQPFFTNLVSANVIGVKGVDLEYLRDTDLPNYIRLHTAGLESDYAMMLREAALMNWQKESKNVLIIDYTLRKLTSVGYYCCGLFKINAGIKEKSNELKNDIVGQDVYGAIRNLYYPSMPFKRYIDYDDLTSEEKKFSHRVGWRSLFDFVDPLLFGKTEFRLNNRYTANFAMGYGMAPFGDYIDENFWLSERSMNAHFYLRQYENKSTWFPAFGADFSDISFIKKISFDIAFHGWCQPKALSFTETTSKVGGAIDVLGKYRFFYHKSGIKGLSIDFGIIAKTQGFLLEEMNMNRHFGVRFGTSFWL